MADNKPASVPSWATDATFSSGPKSGSATKVEPSAGAKAQGDVPGQPYRGERHNWLWNLMCSWLFYLSDLHNQVQFLNKDYHFTGAAFEVDGETNINDRLVVDSDIIVGDQDFTKYVRGGQLRSHKKMIPLTQFSIYDGTGTTAGASYTGIQMYGGHVTCRCMMDLPVGATVTLVRVGVKSTGNGSSDPISFYLQRVTCDTVAPTSANGQTSAGTDVAVAGSYDILTTGAISATVNNSTYINLVIEGGDDAVFSDPDELLWVEVTYNGYFCSEYQ